MRSSVSGKRVLVTGAGGWLGGEVAARLAGAGATVTALMRRPGTALGNDGQPAAVDRTVLGDIAQKRLGWDEPTWQDEARRYDVIVHCAALTRFDAEPELARAVNVGGTGEVVALAEAGGARLLHVSTAYVNGTESGAVMEATPTDELFNNAYERSKAAGEAVVRASGVPAVIARPSIILGDSTEGRVRTFGTFYYLLKLLAEGRVRQMPAEPWATLDLVPIDFVAAGLVALVERFDAAAGQTLHLVSHDPTPLSAFSDTLSRFEGLAVPEFVPPAAFDAPASRTFERLIAPYAPYFLRNPRFDDQAFRALTGLVCPPVGIEWWRVLVRFALDAGFIRQASRGDANGMASEAATPSSAASR